MAFCHRCGSAYETGGARFCPNCGVSLGGADPSAPDRSTDYEPARGQRTRAVSTATANWSVSPAAWATGERVVAGATLFVFMAMLVPWWSFGPFSIDGFHSWGWFCFVGFMGALALLVARLVTSNGRPAVRLPIPLHQAYAICGALELLGSVLYLALTVRDLGFSNVSVGAFMALIGGGVTLLGARDPWTPRPAPAPLVGTGLGVVAPPMPAQAPEPTAVPPCPACGRPNPRETRFCEGCGAETVRRDGGQPATPATSSNPVPAATATPVRTAGLEDPDALSAAQETAMDNSAAASLAGRDPGALLCPGCGSANLAGSRSCASCGTSIEEA